MHWIHLTGEEQLQHIVVKSQEKPQIIFKYSSHCLSSDIVLRKLQEKCCPESADFYFLDLLTYRSLSDKVTSLFHVHHESPQVLLISDGECVYEESHLAINAAELLAQAQLVS